MIGCSFNHRLGHFLQVLLSEAVDVFLCLLCRFGQHAYLLVHLRKALVLLGVELQDFFVYCAKFCFFSICDFVYSVSLPLKSVS